MTAQPESAAPEAAPGPNYRREDGEMRVRVGDRKNLYQTFLATFCDGTPKGKATVEKEIEKYWQENGFVAVQGLVAHLLEWAGKNEPPLRPAVQTILMKEFRQSLVHEKVTNYIPNYQEPLLEALARRYNAVQIKARNLDQLVYLSEVDLSNIGGLNKAMAETVENLYKQQTDGDAQKAQHAKTLIALYERLYVDARTADDSEKKALIANGLADDVIRHVCDVLKRKLADKGSNQVTCVRKGGDELRFYIRLPGDPEVRKNAKERGDDFGVLAQLTADTNAKALDKIETLFKETEKELVEYFHNAGLDGIKHLKDATRGMGLRYASLTLSSKHESEHIEGRNIDAGLLLAKRKKQLAASVGDTKASVGKTSLINLGVIEHSEHIPDAEPMHDLSKYAVKNGNPVTFEEARLEALRDHVAAVLGIQNTELNVAEESAIRGIHQLTRAEDPVTKLPLLARLEKYVFPAFYAQHPGDKARLVLMDFTNIAGANEIGSFVGNAAIRQNIKAVRVALEEYKGGAYANAYLCGKPGGKVVMLLPDSVFQQTGFDINAFGQMLQAKVDEKAQELLGLTKEEKRTVKENLENNIKKLRMPQSYDPAFKEGDVCMKDVANPKNRSRKGVQVYVASTEAIACNSPTRLSHYMKTMEAETQKKQDIKEQKGAQR